MTAVARIMAFPAARERERPAHQPQRQHGDDADFPAARERERPAVIIFEPAFEADFVSAGPCAPRIAALAAVDLAARRLCPGEALAGLGLAWAGAAEPCWQDVVEVLAWAWPHLSPESPADRTAVLSPMAPPVVLDPAIAAAPAGRRVAAWLAVRLLP